MVRSTAWLNVLGDLADLPEVAVGGAVAAAVVLPHVSAVLGGTLATWNRIGFAGGAHAEQVVVDPPGAWVETAVGDVEARMDQHPFAGTLVADSSEIVRLSDLISDRGWRAHPIYVELLRPRGIPSCSIFVPLTARTDEVAFLMFNRDRDFSDRELEGLTLLQGGLSVLLRTPRVQPESTLSPREVEVLTLLARGIGRRQAARALGISSTTIAKHMENIHAKLDTHDIVSTIRKACELGILPAP